MYLNNKVHKITNSMDSSRTNSMGSSRTITNFNNSSSNNNKAPPHNKLSQLIR